MTTIPEDARQLLVDLFSRRGRLPADRFRTAYFVNLTVLTVASPLPLLVPPVISSNLYFLCMGVTFFAVYNVATKRHRDTLPLHIPPINSFRIFSSIPFADQSMPGGFCGIGFGFMAVSSFMLLHFEHNEFLLQFCAMTFFIGSAATLGTRFLWVAPSQPGTNKYGPNPHEVSP